MARDSEEESASATCAETAAATTGQAAATRAPYETILTRPVQAGRIMAQRN
jgi:hypothetical protein